MGASLCAWINCPSAISSKQAISLVDEVHQLLHNSGSDWPFGVKISEKNLLVVGIKFMHMQNVKQYIEYSVCVFEGLKGVVQNEHILYFWLLDPRMVENNILFKFWLFWVDENISRRKYPTYILTTWELAQGKAYSVLCASARKLKMSTQHYKQSQVSEERLYLQLGFFYAVNFPLSDEKPFVWSSFCSTFHVHNQCSL